MSTAPQTDPAVESGRQTDPAASPADAPASPEPGAEFIRPSYEREIGSGSEISRFVHLLWALVVREFKGQYRRSILGPGWAILQPLLYMAIFIFLRSVANFETGDIPYPIFTLCGLVPWTFFANAVARSGASVYLNAATIKKISVRREVFPGSMVALSLIDMAIAFAILGVFMIYYDIRPGLAAAIWLPVLVFLIVALALAMGMGIAAFGTFKRDILFGIPFVLQFWLLASPIMYPLDQTSGTKRFILSLNPISGIVEGFRNVLLENTAPDLALLGITAAITAVIWAIAWPLFHYVSQYFADVV